MTFSQQAARTTTEWRIGAAKTKECIRSQYTPDGPYRKKREAIGYRKRNEIYIQ